MIDKFDAPENLSINKNIPDAFGGYSVAEWPKRAEEIKKLYEYYMYGPLPDMSGEDITWVLSEFRENVDTYELFGGKTVSSKARVANGTIHISNGEKESSFDIVVTLPLGPAPKEGYPVHIEMSFSFFGMLAPSKNAYYLAKRGYASIGYEPTRVAADNSTRTGAFYDLYPYGTDWEHQTGAMAAWGWGASKIVDALENGLGEEINIDPEFAMLSGVSRFGKATLVAGAYDSRFKVVIPTCSGAGGVAMYRTVTTGKTFDLKSFDYENEDGGTTHLTTQNEHIQSLQSHDEGHWFNDNFLKFDCFERLPVDQHMLASLIADENRFLFLVNGILGEDWTNPGAMTVTYLETKKVFNKLGFSDHLCINVHLLGHALKIEDLEKSLDFCDIRRGLLPDDGSRNFVNSVFLEEENLRTIMG